MPKVARWTQFLQDFNYEVVERSGSEIKHVNALRQNAELIVSRSHDELTSKIKIAKQEDEHIQTIKILIETNENSEYFMEMASFINIKRRRTFDNFHKYAKKSTIKTIFGR